MPNIRPGPRATKHAIIGPVPQTNLVKHGALLMKSPRKSEERRERLRKWEEWRPVGMLFVDPKIPVPSIEALLPLVVQGLGITTEEKTSCTLERIEKMAIEYWEIKRSEEAPIQKWYRAQVQPVLTATEALLEVLREAHGATGRSALYHATKRHLGRSLTQRTRGPGDPESIEELLAELVVVCKQCQASKKLGGRRPGKALRFAAKELAGIWREFHRKPIPQSFEIAKANTEGKPLKQDLTYPAPRFVQLVFETIDPSVAAGSIAYALRGVLSKRKRRKTATQ